MGSPKASDLGLMKDKYEHVPPPKSISDLPRFIRQVVGGFFGRLAYIFKMVWETGHWILILMMLFSIITGLLPIVGSINLTLLSVPHLIAICTVLLMK